jgi:hypothetical protein
VRLVKHASEEAEPYSSQAISRARKRLMAEISLGGDEIIIDDVSYSRNDASTLLDLVTEDSWKAHTIIYNHKGLLNFLEKEEFNHEELKKTDAYLYNERFVHAVSSYFSHAFSAVSGKLIRQNKFEELLLLMDYQGYILPEHSHEAYQKFRTYLDETNSTLRNLSWEKFIADESILHFIFSDPWKQAINKLPSSFTAIRDDLIEQLTGIVLRFQHKATWYYLHQLLVQMKAVETNEFNRLEVVRINEIIFANSQLEGGKKSRASDGGEVSTGRIIWWLIWIVLAIVRFATCNSPNKSSYDISNYSYRRLAQPTVNTYAEQKNEKVLLSLLDSLSNRKNIVTKPEKLTTGDQPFEALGDDPQAAQNVSIVITNHTGFDAVFLYFKDMPGHYRSGLLPKLYSSYIRKGESEKLYVLPGNGRIYFAFGEQWGKLKKPVEMYLSNASNEALNNRSSLSETIVVNSFFGNKKRLQQDYLTNPIYIDEPDSYQEDNNYFYLNTPGEPSGKNETDIILSRKNGRFSMEAFGRLLVKEKALTKHLREMDDELQNIKIRKAH